MTKTKKRAVEIQKQDSHFPVAVSMFLKKSERRIPLNAGFPVVQAHRSFRICCLARIAAEAGVIV